MKTTKAKPVRFTKDEDAFLKEHYNNPEKTIRGISNAIERTPSSVIGRLKVLGLKTDKSVIELRRKNSYYKKGRVPPNKGKKITEYTSAESLEKIKNSWFKKGHTPVTTKSIGSERTTKCGYIQVKVAEPNKWRLKHVVVWEAKNGRIPKDLTITFRDFNRTNCSLNNLELITRKENLRRNKHSRCGNWDLEMAKRAISHKINKINKINK